MGKRVAGWKLQPTLKTSKENPHDYAVCVCDLQPLFNC